MDRPIRVLMVTSEWPTPQSPYAVPYLVRQVEFLRRAGVDVDVFSFRGAKRVWNYAKAWLRLRRQLRQGRYELVHAHWAQSALLAFPRRLPLVVTFHGCDLNGVKGSNGKTTAAGRLLRFVGRGVARRADAVIAVSEGVSANLPLAVPATVLPLGLDLDSVPLVPREAARRQLGLPLGENLVLFVGDPAETVKRYYLARQAVEKLNETLPAKLILGWGVPNRDILLLMNACDVLVLSSMQEGSPTVVKEALACNLPVVSLNVGDVASRLRGVAGCEVCGDDRPETIAGSLERVLKRGGRVNGRKAVADLDEAALTKKLVQIYRAAIAASKPLPGAARSADTRPVGAPAAELATVESSLPSLS